MKKINVCSKSVGWCIDILILITLNIFYIISELSIMIQQDIQINLKLLLEDISK